MSGRENDLVRFIILGAVFALAACANESTELVVASPDQMQFQTEVYPVLLRDCAFQACHSSTDRFLQVFGPGRARIAADIKPLDPELPIEISHAYERARSMIDAKHPERSLLVKKPLATSAGGSGHEGADALGRNVYQSKLEPGWLAISRWALGQSNATLPAGAVPAGAVGNGGVQR
jgi:hypothetical protein